MRSGLLAEFGTPEALLAAAARLRALGVTHLDAFTPYPVPGLEATLGLRRSRIPAAVLVCALLGGAAGYLAQWWMNAVSYPLNVGGRPLHSAPAFVPITFEMCVLGGALAAFVGLLVATHLPRLWDPVFEVEGIERATIDRFFLAIERDDPRFGAVPLRGTLEQLGALRIAELGGAP